MPDLHPHCPNSMKAAFISQAGQSLRFYRTVLSDIEHLADLDTTKSPEGSIWRVTQLSATRMVSLSPGSPPSVITWDFTALRVWKCETLWVLKSEHAEQIQVLFFPPLPRPPGNATGE